MNLLLRNNPHAALARRGVGRLPLHYAIFADSPSLEVSAHASACVYRLIIFFLYGTFCYLQLIQALLAAAPECAQVTDVYGRLALHYAVDKPTPNLAVVDCLLAAFPGGKHSHLTCVDGRIFFVLKKLSTPCLPICAFIFLTLLTAFL